jgi:hypothetical protein
MQCNNTFAITTVGTQLSSTPLTGTSSNLLYYLLHSICAYLLLNKLITSTPLDTDNTKLPGITIPIMLPATIHMEMTIISFTAIMHLAKH